MATIKIDQERLAAMITGLESCNNRICDAYTDVENSIRQLMQAWDAPSTDHAIAAFYSIKPRYGDPYRNTVESYIEVLRVLIGQGYAETESTNTSLADAFL